MSERHKMLAGELYDPLDPELVAARERARDLCQNLNATRESQQTERRQILTALFGTGGSTVWMQPPFYCDYGSNIELGERVFFNFNCVVLDVCRVSIGDYTLLGPAVQIYTPMHPLNAVQRRTQEYGKPVEIGSDVWVGGGALILPGVRIGARVLSAPGRLGGGGQRRGIEYGDVASPAQGGRPATRKIRHHPVPQIDHALVGHRLP